MLLPLVVYDISASRVLGVARCFLRYLAFGRGLEEIVLDMTSHRLMWKMKDGNGGPKKTIN